MTLLPRIAFKAGRSRGNGTRNGVGLAGVALLIGRAAVSYEGGGSVGAASYLLSAIVRKKKFWRRYEDDERSFSPASIYRSGKVEASS